MITRIITLSDGLDHTSVRVVSNINCVSGVVAGRTYRPRLERGHIERSEGKGLTGSAVAAALGECSPAYCVTRKMTNTGMVKGNQSVQDRKRTGHKREDTRMGDESRRVRVDVDEPFTERFFSRQLAQVEEFSTRDV